MSITDAGFEHDVVVIGAGMCGATPNSANIMYSHPKASLA